MLVCRQDMYHQLFVCVIGCECQWTASFTRLRLCMKDNKYLYSAVFRYNWQSASSIGWLFPIIKHKYILQIKCTEAILSNSNCKLLRLENSKILISVKKTYCVIYYNFWHTFLPYATESICMASPAKS